jgi:hypothetical protein
MRFCEFRSNYPYDTFELGDSSAVDTFYCIAFINNTVSEGARPGMIFLQDSCIFRDSAFIANTVDFFFGQQGDYSGCSVTLFHCVFTQSELSVTKKVLLKTESFTFLPAENISLDKDQCWAEEPSTTFSSSGEFQPSVPASPSLNFIRSNPQPNSDFFYPSLRFNASFAISETSPHSNSIDFTASSDYLQTISYGSSDRFSESDSLSGSRSFEMSSVDRSSSQSQVETDAESNSESSTLANPESVSSSHSSIPSEILDSTVSDSPALQSSTFMSSNEFTSGVTGRVTSNQSMIWIGVGAGIGVLVVVVLIILIIVLRRRERSGTHSAEIDDEPGLIGQTTPWAEVPDTFECLNPMVASADVNAILSENLDPDGTGTHG